MKIINIMMLSWLLWRISWWLILGWGALILQTTAAGENLAGTTAVDLETGDTLMSTAEIGRFDILLNFNNKKSWMLLNPFFRLMITGLVIS
jgi:hypothetical protein